MGDYYEVLEDEDDPAWNAIADVVGKDHANDPDVTGIPEIDAIVAGRYQVRDKSDARKEAGAEKNRLKVEAGNGEEKQNDLSIAGALFGKGMSAFDAIRKQPGKALAAKPPDRGGAYLPNGMMDILAGGCANTQDWLLLNYNTSASGDDSAAA